MNKHYIKIVATLALATPLIIGNIDTAVATNNEQIIIPAESEIPKIYINNDRKDNEQDGTDVRVLTTSDIANILKKYDMINHPDRDAQILLEKMYIYYEDGLPVKATSAVGESRVYRFNDENIEVSNLDIYTEYGNTTKDGYDSMTYVKFIGDEYDSYILMDVIESMFLDTYEITDIMRIVNSDTDEEIELTFDHCIVDIKKGIRNLSGIQSVELRVYENKGVHDGKILNTVRLSELEHLVSQESFKEIKNYGEGKAEILNKVSNFDSNKDFTKDNEITSVKYERAWTHVLDTETMKEQDDFDVYYVEKTISCKDNWNITLHVDNYDRFNMDREYFISVSGTETKPFLEEKAESLLGSIEKVYNSDYTTENFKSLTISKYED